MAEQLEADQPEHLRPGIEPAHEDSVRLYVDEGASAIPLILRALDGAAVPLGTIELHRPSLDDVFLTKTGRSLRES